MSRRFSKRTYVDDPYDAPFEWPSDYDDLSPTWGHSYSPSHRRRTSAQSSRRRSSPPRRPSYDSVLPRPAPVPRRHRSPVQVRRPPPVRTDDTVAAWQAHVVSLQTMKAEVEHILRSLKAREQHTRAVQSKPITATPAAHETEPRPQVDATLSASSTLSEPSLDRTAFRGNIGAPTSSISIVHHAGGSSSDVLTSGPGSAPQEVDSVSPVLQVCVPQLALHNFSNEHFERSRQVENKGTTPSGGARRLAESAHPSLTPLVSPNATSSASPDEILSDLRMGEATIDKEAEASRPRPEPDLELERHPARAQGGLVRQADQG